MRMRGGGVVGLALVAGNGEGPIERQKWTALSLSDAGASLEVLARTRRDGHAVQFSVTTDGTSVSSTEQLSAAERPDPLKTGLTFDADFVEVPGFEYLQLLPCTSRAR
jgi:hypothetical protein